MPVVAVVVCSELPNAHEAPRVLLFFCVHVQFLSVVTISYGVVLVFQCTVCAPSHELRAPPRITRGPTRDSLVSFAHLGFFL